MGLSASEFRELARNCFKDADLKTDADGKQMLLEIGRLYIQMALQIESCEAVSRTRLQ